jgi:hypothetical protein
MALHDAVGMVGVGLIMLMYILLQTGRTGADRPSFSAGNAAGAAMILYSLAFDFNLAAVVVEGFWLLISLYGMWRSLRLRRPG